jgi:hypothetical protein
VLDHRNFVAPGCSTLAGTCLFRWGGRSIAIE